MANRDTRPTFHKTLKNTNMVVFFVLYMYYIASEGRCWLKWCSCSRTQLNIMWWDEWIDYSILKAVFCKQNHCVNRGVHVPKCNASVVNNEICRKPNVFNWNQRRNYMRKLVKRRRKRIKKKIITEKQKKENNRGIEMRREKY